LTYWKNILEPDHQSTNTDKKKFIISKSTESSNIIPNWKELLPSLELLHNDQLILNHRQELIRPLFQMLEKSLNQIEEFEQKTYIHQLCTTALLNVYTKLKPGFYILKKKKNSRIDFEFR
jgi:hypothetical protein